MKDVWVQETSFGGMHIYVVYVDGKPYETLYLRTGPSLTFAEQNDMASYYQEALNGSQED